VESGFSRGKLGFAVESSREIGKVLQRRGRGMGLESGSLN
jgi:hypothetical protein